MNSVNFFQTTPRIVMGPGSFNQLPHEVKRLGRKKIMIITDPGLVRTGIVSRLEELLVGLV